MAVHLESVNLEKMSMTLKNFIEMMSPTYFEIVAQFQERLPYSFLNQTFLQWNVQEKEYMKFDVGMIVN